MAVTLGAILNNFLQFMDPFSRVFAGESDQVIMVIQVTMLELLLLDYLAYFIVSSAIYR